MNAGIFSTPLQYATPIRPLLGRPTPIPAINPQTRPLFLDTFAVARLAFSLRRLSSAYTGPVVRVRRSSDSAEQDFSAAEVYGGALEYWVGAGNNGFVRTWYDQSGNGSHAEQATAAAQPKVVNNGLLCVDGKGFPTILCDGGLYGLRVLGSRIFAGDIYMTLVIQPTISGSINGFVFSRISGFTGLTYIVVDVVNRRWVTYNGVGFIGNLVGNSLPSGQVPYRLISARWINGPSGTGWFRTNGVIESTTNNLDDNTLNSNQSGLTLFSDSAIANPYVGTLTEFIVWKDSRPGTFQQIDDELLRNYNLL